MSESQPTRVLFYVQHLLGIGHLMRVRRIVLALRNHNFDVALVTGGMPLPGFDVPGINHIELPPIAVSSTDFRTLVDASGTPIDDVFKQNRCKVLLNTYQIFSPEIVVIEAFPFGRRQVRFELLPLIDAIEASNPKPLLLASIRDILQTRIKPDRDAESARLVRTHFDKVLVHGDPAFATLDASFSHAADIADSIIYTGMVSGPPPAATSDQFNVVVSAGGGAVGATLVRTCIEASRHLSAVDSWCVITGPNLPESEFEQIAGSSPQNVTVERFRTDFTALLAGAQLSISQAGYNTVSDVLQAGCRSVLVPFAVGGETEQLARAHRLKELGLATLLTEQELSKGQLVIAIQAALSQTPPAVPIVINADGANNTAGILQDLVGERESANLDRLSTD